MKRNTQSLKSRALVNVIDVFTRAAHGERSAVKKKDVKTDQDDGTKTEKASQKHTRERKPTKILRKNMTMTSQVSGKDPNVKAILKKVSFTEKGPAMGRKETRDKRQENSELKVRE